MEQTASESGLRQRKKARQREQIIRAGLELIRQRGYEESTVQEIARRAEISLPTFYNYFPSKDALLREFALTGWSPVLERFLVKKGSIQLRLRVFLRALADHIMKDRELWVALAVSNVYNPVRDPDVLFSAHSATRLLEALLAEGQRRGELTGDLSAVRLASYLEGLLLRACIEWGASFPQKHDLRRTIDEAFDFFMRGARP